MPVSIAYGHVRTPKDVEQIARQIFAQAKRSNDPNTIKYLIQNRLAYLVTLTYSPNYRRILGEKGAKLARKKAYKIYLEAVAWANRRGIPLTPKTFDI